MRRKIFIGFIVMLAITAVSIAIANRPIQAQSASQETDVLKRLNEIASDQKAILTDLAFIKEELRIIKIRVTQRS